MKPINSRWASQTLVGLLIVQMAAIGVALAAAIAEIETIVVSGPLLSAVGVLITVLAAARRLRQSVGFGLAVPAISMVCFALIHVFEWAPHQAQTPIGALLAVFAFASLPLGYSALREADPRSEPSLRPFQFRLASLLGVMAVMAPPLALLRISPAAGAVGVLIGYALLLAYALHRFYAGRGPEKSKKEIEADAWAEMNRTWDEIRTWPDQQRLALAARINESLSQP
jgi:hypothetical protein